MRELHLKISFQVWRRLEKLIWQKISSMQPNESSQKLCLLFAARPTHYSGVDLHHKCEKKKKRKWKRNGKRNGKEMEKNRNYYLGQKSSSTRSEGSFNHNSLKSQLNQSFSKSNMITKKLSFNVDQAAPVSSICFKITGANLK